MEMGVTESEVRDGEISHTALHLFSFSPSFMQRDSIH